MTTVAILLGLSLSLLVTMKVVGYLWELSWQILRGGAYKQRELYMRRYRRGRHVTYTDEERIGRPLPFVPRPSARAAVKYRKLVYVWGVLFKAPTVVIVGFIVSAFIRAWAPSWLLVLVAFEIAGLLLLVTGTAMSMRLILGPLDRMNPDLGIGRFANRGRGGVVYPSDNSALIRYFLVLMVLIEVGYTAIYANIATVNPLTLGVSEPGSVFEWFYVAVTVASTFGSSGSSPQTDMGYIFVASQLICLVLVIAWLGSSIFRQDLPATDDKEWDFVDEADDSCD